MVRCGHLVKPNLLPHDVTCGLIWLRADKKYFSHSKLLDFISAYLTRRPISL